jgi:hypothetical protein
MLRLADSVRKTHTPDGAVVLDVKHGRMFRFNSTGSRILQLLSSGTEEQEIAAMLVREFSADPVTAESDASTFLASLQRYALVETRLRI